MMKPINISPRRYLKVLPLILLFYLSIPPAFAQWSQQVKENLMAKSASDLVGSVMIDEAVIGAAIQVYDYNGNLLYEAENATEGFEGRFTISKEYTRSFPFEFQIIATGGLHKGEPFQGKLICDAKKWPKEIFGLNPVTTLISRYRGYYPELSFKEATFRVKRFLMIPMNSGLVGHLKPNFYGDIFLKQSYEMGGFNSFIDTLVLAVDDPEFQLTPFVHPPASPETSILKVTLGEIGKGILREMGGETFGSLLNIIFGDPTEDKLDAILDKLDQLAEQVYELGDDLKIEIRSSTLEEYIGNINTQFDKYRYYAELNPDVLTETEKANRQREIENIKAFAEQYFENYLTFIRNQILKGTVSDPRSLLQIWTDKVIAETNEKNLYGPILKTNSYYDELGESVLTQYMKIESLFLHYVAAQNKAALVLAEIYNTFDQPLSLKYLQEELYRKYMKEETDLFLQCVEKFILSSYWLCHFDIMNYKHLDTLNLKSLIECEFDLLTHKSILKEADSLAAELTREDNNLFVFRFLLSKRTPEGWHNQLKFWLPQYGYADFWTQELWLKGSVKWGDPACVLYREAINSIMSNPETVAEIPYYTLYFYDKKTLPTPRKYQLKRKSNFNLSTGIDALVTPPLLEDILFNLTNSLISSFGGDLRVPYKLSDYILQNRGLVLLTERFEECRITSLNDIDFPNDISFQLRYTDLEGSEEITSTDTMLDAVHRNFQINRYGGGLQDNDWLRKSWYHDTHKMLRYIFYINDFTNVELLPTNSNDEFLLRIPEIYPTIYIDSDYEYDHVYTYNAMPWSCFYFHNQDKFTIGEK